LHHIVIQSWLKMGLGGLYEPIAAKSDEGYLRLYNFPIIEGDMVKAHYICPFSQGRDYQF